MRRSTLAPTVAALSLFCAACGSDHQSKLNQQDHSSLDGTSLLEPSAAENECLTSANCEDGDRCTANRCLDGRCVAIPIPSDACCESELLFDLSFDDDLDGVSFSQLNGGAGWTVLSGRASSPPASLYFGNPDQMSYDAGTQVAGEVTLPAIELPADREAIVTMRIFAQIETSDTFDVFAVHADVLVDGVVTDTHEILGKRELPADAYQDFALVEAPLEGLAGSTVVIRLSFDSIDGNNNNFEGIYVDDLQVLAACPIAGPCASDAECDDGDACTATACSEIGCVSTVICSEDQGLDPCELPDAEADCCTTDSDCDDGDIATINVCNGATCETTLNPDVCLDDPSCDDGEACTSDRCNQGLCEHAGVIGEGCCVPGEVAIADFDTDSQQGIYVTDNFETGIFWTTDRTRSSSGDFSLYCGDPLTQTYSHDRRVKSSATTRVLSIPKGGQTNLVFDLYKDTRAAKNFDVFQVFVLRDGALLGAWSSKTLKTGNTLGFERISVPLTTYAGRDVQVRFVFDSVDAPSGAFEGVYIDTLGLQTVCD